MEPGQQDWTKLSPDEEADTKRTARINVALQQGWQIRQDLLRGEFIAARDMHVGRTMDDLLDTIEAVG